LRFTKELDVDVTNPSLLSTDNGREVQWDAIVLLGYSRLWVVVEKDERRRRKEGDSYLRTCLLQYKYQFVARPNKAK
jgi:hypothetical protein